MKTNNTLHHFFTVVVTMLMMGIFNVSAQQNAGTLSMTGTRPSMPHGSLLEKRYMLGQQLNNQWRNMMVQTPITSLSPMMGVPLNTPSGAKFRSNIISNSHWPEARPEYGLYDFQSTSSELTTYYLDDVGIMHCEYGGAWIGNFYYMVMAYGYMGLGQIYVMYVFNMATMEWDANRSGIIPNQDITYLAWTNTPYDKETQLCYGYFFDSSGTALDFCSMDYASLQKQKISVPNRVFIVLAIDDSDGQLYGIDMSGDLYRIDKNSGEETLVGNTGIKPSNLHQAADIDSEPGILYWTYMDENYETGLAAVDMKTGAATKSFTFDGIIQFGDITLIGGTVDDLAPDKVHDLTWNVNAEDYNKVDVSFVMPERTNDNSTELEGKISYKVAYGETIVAQGGAAPGEKVEMVLDNLPLQQLISLSVVAANDNGDSGASNVDVWAGKDTPQPVENLMLSIGADNMATVTWNAPKGGVHGGYVNLDELRYSISRMPGNVPCGETAATTYSEELIPSDYCVYYYNVQPVYDGTVADAETVSSNKVVIGEYIVPPYDTDFADLDMINDYWTIRDNDKNGLTWEWDSILKLMRLDIYEGGDDYLISPPVYLEAGHVYTAQFDAYTVMGGKMEMTYGQGSNVYSYKVLINPTPLNVDIPMTYSAELQPAETGVYHFALHEMSNYGIYTDITGFRVSQGADLNAPDMPLQMAVVPGENGALSATVNCILPQISINQTNLDNIDNVVVYRNGTEIANLTENLTPGGSMTFVDSDCEEGLLEYEVRAGNAFGLGRAASAKAYVGQDEPMPPVVESLTQNDDGSLTIRWQNSPKGIHGGYVNVDGLKNMLYNVEDGVKGDVIALIDGGAAFTFSPDLSGKPGWYYVALSSVDGRNRESESTIAHFIKGSPVALPFSESFAGGAVHESLFWWGFPLVGSSNWTMDSRSCDGDGGSLAFVHKEAGDEAVVGTRPITLQDTENPFLTFSYYSNQLCSSILSVEIDRAQSGTVDKLAEFDMNKDNRSGGWKKVTVDLSDYRNERYIIVRFHGKGVVAKANDVLGIDGVSITDMAPNDLAVELEAPEVIYTGQTAKIKLSVLNRCNEESHQYVARLGATVLVNGEMVELPLGEAEDTGLPASGGRQDYVFEFTPDPFMLDDVSFKVELTHEGDAKLSNNVAEAKSFIYSNLAPAVNDLTAVVQNPAYALLTWGQPEGDAVALESVTDDFESYSPWALDFGEWETYDGDGGYSGAIFGGVSYPNQGSPFSFIIFTPNNLVSNATTQVPQLTPHSGKQYASTIYAVNSTQNDVVDQDNWLISPELSGLPQTVSFFAKSMSKEYPVEQFEVLYSLTDNEHDSFVKLGDTYTVNDVDNWNFISVSLPRGAKYFAIRDVTSKEDAFMLMIDDVSFTMVSEIGLDITGYNIYVDGELYKTIDGVANQTLVGPLGDGEHQIYITVLYGEQKLESPLSNPASVVTVIKDVLTETDLRNLEVEIYSPAGVKVAEGIDVVGKLNRGVYMVRIKGSDSVVAFIKK